jgi:hypothetical protein
LPDGPEDIEWQVAAFILRRKSRCLACPKIHEAIFSSIRTTRAILGFVSFGIALPIEAKQRPRYR